MKKQNIIILFVLLSVISGSCLPLLKASYESVPPIYFLTFRFGLAFLLILAYLRGYFFKGITKQTIFPMLLISIVLAGGYVIYNLSVMLTTSTNANFFANSSVMMIPFIAKAVNKTPYTKRLFVGIAIMVVGIFGLVNNEGVFTLNLGDVLGLVSAAIFAVQIVLVGKYIHRLEPVVLAGFEFGLTAFVALVLSAIFENIPAFTDFMPIDWVAIILIAVFSTVGMFVMQNFAQRRLSESITGIIIAMIPLYTAISSSLILGEQLSIIGKLGGILMVVGAIIASTKGKGNFAIKSSTE